MGVWGQGGSLHNFSCLNKVIELRDYENIPYRLNLNLGTIVCKANAICRVWPWSSLLPQQQFKDDPAGTLNT